jgi:hypothetical protein
MCFFFNFFVNPRRIAVFVDDCLFCGGSNLKKIFNNLYRNRDAEEKLMKDVEGWEVGTWYGHPIYKVSLSVIVSTVPLQNSSNKGVSSFFLLVNERIWIRNRIRNRSCSRKRTNKLRIWLQEAQKHTNPDPNPVH